MVVKRTPEGKRVRVKYLFKEVNPGAVGAYDSDEWVIQDDIRIIGWEHRCRASLNDSPNVEEGLIDFQSILSRGGYINGDSFLTMLTGRLTNVVEVAYSHMIQNDAVCHHDLMFPDGHGIDIDEGEPLTLWVYSRETIMTDGTCYFLGHCLIYYVER